MSDHRVLLTSLNAASEGSFVDIAGDEAHHLARVKRVVAGNAVGVFDGHGCRAEAIVDHIAKSRAGEWIVTVKLGRVEHVPRIVPQVEVWASTPKGDRLASMIDGLSQVGASAWAPLHTSRTVVDPRDHKLDRLTRVASEASKQCGRAWHLDIMPGGTMKDALQPGVTIIIADATGATHSTLPHCDRYRLLIGPEGGFTPTELEQARNVGAHLISFGVHTMRVETAAVVAAATLLAHSPRTK